MFEVHHITKSFKTDFWRSPFYALKDVSFHVNEGRATGFLGPNGAGKTTLIKILMGFIGVDKGHISFHEKMGKGRTSIFSHIGFVPERPYFYPHLKGRAFLEFMGKLSNVEGRILNENIEFFAKELNIDHALDKKISTYSKGMLQRLGFVAALLHNPELLVLDEPLAGLDPIGRRELKNIITSLIQKGKTVFFSSHIIPDIEEVCQDVVVLEKGEIFYQGRINNLLKEKGKSITKIHYRQFDEERVEELPDKEVNDKLKTLIDDGGEVLSVTPKKPTLEEIVYYDK